MSKKKNLDSDELLEVMTAFMDKLDQKVEKLDDVTQNLKEKPEESPENESREKVMRLRVDIQSGEPDGSLGKITPADEDYIRSGIKNFMETIMTHPSVQKIEILADKRG